MVFQSVVARGAAVAGWAVTGGTVTGAEVFGVETAPGTVTRQADVIISMKAMISMAAFCFVDISLLLEKNIKE